MPAACLVRIFNYSFVTLMMNFKSTFLTAGGIAFKNSTAINCQLADFQLKVRVVISLEDISKKCNAMLQVLLYAACSLVVIVLFNNILSKKASACF